MKKTAILLIAILVISVLFISGCNEQKKDSNKEIDILSKFIGSWNSTSTLDGEGYVFTFFSNNTWSVDTGQSGTYALKEGKLELTNISGVSYLFDYSFSNSDNTLTIIQIEDGSIEILNKQQNEE